MMRLYQQISELQIRKIIQMFGYIQIQYFYQRFCLQFQSTCYIASNKLFPSFKKMNQSYKSISIFAIIICLIKISFQVNTVPLLWKYQTNTFIQCGQYTITPSNATIPQNPGIDYTITFNNLKNPSTIFKPAIGYTDIKYMFQTGIYRYVVTYSYAPSGGNFKFHVFAINSDSFLSRFTINYLAVSQDFTQFFICIDFHIQGVGIQINSTRTQTFTVPYSIALPSMINIKYAISIININIYSNQSNNLFDQQFTINMINRTHYNWTLNAPLAKTYVYGMGHYVIFYQHVANPNSLIFKMYVNFNNLTPINVTNSGIYSNNLVDSFQVYKINTFFGLSRIAAISNVDFTLTYSTINQISMSITQTQILQGDLLIFRQPNPTCPSEYVISFTKTQCVCNSAICFSTIGCSQAIAINSMSPTCSFCLVLQNFYMNLDGICVCKVGYQLINETCTEICGDGMKINDQCDDGNTINNDGCSSVCQIQNGFSCKQNSNGVSVCLFQQNICFQVIKIEKNEDNTALFYFQAIGNSLPFNFLINQFVVYETINLTVKNSNSNNNYEIRYSIISIINKQIVIWVNFNENIQGAKASISFNFNHTKYLSQDCTLNFDCVGSQSPLIASKFTPQYKTISIISMIFIILLTLIFFISLFAPKWIGIQALQAIQLIFFSQMLIVDFKNLPPAFSAFKYFKYANGYNNIFFSDPIYSISNLSLSNINKKWTFLQFEQLFLSNFLICSLFILILCILSIIFCLITNTKQKKYFLLREKINDKSLYISYKQMSKISQKSYQILLNIVMWSMLQFLASISCQISFQGKIITNGTQRISQQLFVVNTLSITLCFFMIIFVSFNNLYNLWLSNYSKMQLKKKPQLLTYKWINFSYHLILATIIFCCNTLTIKIIPLSMFVIICQFLYIWFLIHLKPYKQCLKIHQIGLIFIRSVFLVFLILITIINLVPEIDQRIILTMCCFIVFMIFLIIIISCVRLYYDLRYGEKLQDKLRKQRELKQFEDIRRRRQKNEQQLQRLKKQTSKKIQVKLSHQQKVRKTNIYLYQNQVQQDKQMQFLQWLYKRNHLSKEEKQRAYYEKYAQKPLRWLEIHQPLQFQKRMLQYKKQKHQKQKKKDLIKSIKDQQELKQLKQQMRKDYLHKKLGVNCKNSEYSLK